MKKKRKKKKNCISTFDSLSPIRFAGLTSIPVTDDQSRIRWTPGDADSVARVTKRMNAVYKGKYCRYIQFDGNFVC